ncbi:MAG: NAD-dependent deacylase [Nitrospirae bacterium]|nr:NAD-dependent deacylase [Nitrospirota bacterium]
MDFKERIEKAVELIKKAGYITAFTGAGISTESGISDFRSPGGIWDRYRIITYQEFLQSSDARQQYWKMKHELFRELRNAKPNNAHKALALLEAKGILKAVITQNIDGLHQDAGSSRVIELHGTNRKAECVNCSKTWPIEEIDEKLEEVEFEPVCDHCGGYIKPATVSFGQPMPEKEMMEAVQEAQRSDLMFMIGSSLQVEPAASIPRITFEKGGKLIFINRTETPWDHLASVVFRESASRVMDAILEALQF